MRQGETLIRLREVRRSNYPANNNNKKKKKQREVRRKRRGRKSVEEKKERKQLLNRSCSREAERRSAKVKQKGDRKK